jgi:hypothetical protein
LDFAPQKEVGVESGSVVLCQECEVFGSPPILPPTKTQSDTTAFSFRPMQSHREVLSVIEDLRRHGMCKFSVEDVQSHHDILFPDGQSPESVGVRLRELSKNGILGKEYCGKRVIYYAFSEVRQ